MRILEVKDLVDVSVPFDDGIANLARDAFADQEGTMMRHRYRDRIRNQWTDASRLVVGGADQLEAGVGVE